MTTTTFSYSLAEFIPFRDLVACERVRAIRKEDITRHRNPEFQIRVIENPGEFYQEFAIDIVRHIRQSVDAGRKLVMILPVGPMPQYDLAARLINEFGLSCRHVTIVQHGRVCRPGRQHGALRLVGLLSSGR